MAACCTTVSTSSPQPPAPADPTHTTMGAIWDLPENLLREVFTRVGSVTSLFALAMTCRGWLRRFTDAAFLRETLCPGHHPEAEGDHRARLLGILQQQVQTARRESWPWTSGLATPTFLPAPGGSPLGPLAGPLFADGEEGNFNYAKPLAARRGVVLMRLAPRSTDAEVVEFGVCNPVTGGDRHVLPPLGYGCVRGYAIVTAADTDLDNRTTGRFIFAFSQLLVITESRWSSYHLHTYSAGTRSWSTRTCRCLDADRYSLVGERSAVVHRGAAHWLCIIHGHDNVQAQRDDRLYKLSVEVATGAISLTKLPVRGDGGGKPLLCVTRDGKLAVAFVCHEHVALWTQPAGDEEDGSAAVAARQSRRKRSAPWPGTSFGIPPAPVMHDPDGPPKWQSKEEWCNFGQGSILVLYRSGHVAILDLHKKVMKKAGKLRKCSRPPSSNWDRRRVAYVFYEMDLVELFTRQLGGVLGRDGLGPE